MKHLELRDGRVVFSDSVEEPGPNSPFLSEIQIIANELTPDGAKDFQVSGKAVSHNKTGAFSVNGKVDATPAFGGDWKGRVTANITDFPTSVLIGLMADLHIDLPISEGLINASAELDGGARDFKASGELNFSNGMILPGKLFASPAPIVKASTKFTAQRVGDILTIDVRRSPYRA